MWRRRVQGVSQDVSKTSPAIQATAVEAITSELKALNASLLLKQLQRGVILQVAQACRKRWQLGNHTLRMVSDFSLLGPLWFVNISISITFWTSPSTVNDCLDADYPSIYVQIVTLTIVSCSVHCRSIHCWGCSLPDKLSKPRIFYRAYTENQVAEYKYQPLSDAFW